MNYPVRPRCFSIRRIYLKIFLAFALRHFRATNDRARLQIIGQLLKGEGVTNNILGERHPSFFVISCNPCHIVNAETGVAPIHKFLDKVLGITQAAPTELSCCSCVFFYKQVAPTGATWRCKPKYD